jgi:hypothetical protein
MKKHILLLLMLCTVLFAAHQAAAATCPVTGDVYIDSGSPTENFNDKTRVLISWHPTHGTARGLWKFNIASSIQPSLIKSAKFHLSGSIHTGGGDAIDVYCYALNVPFNEGSDTWDSLSGGNYDTSVFSSGSLPAGNDWETTINVTALVKGNLTKVRNNGMLIMKQDEGVNSYQNIASRETTDPEDFAAYLEIALNTDTDADGVADIDDNCLNKPNGPNLGTCSATSDNPGINCTSAADCASGCSSNGLCIKDQRDTDADDFGDVCDYCDGNGAYDADNDGHCDGEDNCPNTCNVKQLDADGDGMGDVCDTTPGCGGCSGVACEELCS